MTDIEGGLRAALRAAGLPGVGTRVFVDVEGSPALPYVTVGLVDSQDDTSDAPVDAELVQLDAWGSTKREAHEVYRSLRTWLRTTVPGSTLAPGTTFKGARVVPGTSYLPDDDGTPRYVITAEILVAP